MNLQFIRKLPIPMDLKTEIPLQKDLQAIVEKRDIELKNILCGKDNRLILIIGPCSADNEESVLEYCYRLKEVYEKVKDKIFIIPRVYTSKPRTDGKGYKGILHQPDPSGDGDIWTGIKKVRSLHLNILEQTGFTSADELLYTDNYKYFDDLIGYAAVGARSVENQQHRLTASGMSIPVGMKNPTSGNLRVLLKSIVAAETKQHFIYRSWEVKSDGNPFTHAILRGYSSSDGRYVPNYDYENLCHLKEMFDNSDISCKAAIVDCNHGNSGKDAFKQTSIALNVLESRNKNADIKNMVKGLMVESYLEDGTQNIGDNVFGKSITDPCIGWEKTKILIDGILEII